MTVKDNIKALIIGGGGFVGGYLASYLHSECKWEVNITKMKNETIDCVFAEIFDADILNIESIKKVINDVRPKYIFHLAAQSSVFSSWKNPALTIDVNVKGTINVLDAVRNIDGYEPKILLIGSGEEYGHIKENETPINEENVLRPGNIYAATKAMQNFIGKIYSEAYNMNIIMVRAFNHIGPGQASNFVVSDFCRQIAEIEKGLRENVIKVGNLSAIRDFTDVRDVVRAYSMIIQKGKPGNVYNVGSGKAISIEDILNIIIKISGADVNIEVDENKLRPVDIKIIEADISKLVEATDWQRKYELKDTISDTLDFWRKMV